MRPTSPSPGTGTIAPAAATEHHKIPSQSPFLALSSRAWSCWGTSPTLPRKPHYVNNEPFAPCWCSYGSIWCSYGSIGCSVQTKFGMCGGVRLTSVGWLQQTHVLHRSLMNGIDTALYQRYPYSGNKCPQYLVCVTYSHRPWTYSEE